MPFRIMRDLSNSLTQAHHLPHLALLPLSSARASTRSPVINVYSRRVHDNPAHYCTAYHSVQLPSLMHYQLHLNQHCIGALLTTSLTLYYPLPLSSLSAA